ncbi:MAG: hypothetical protein DHS20C12_12910 [Pseudohongiella sp.]|nr:MAG: hypothetical protein DHS20C12_12910 [Pseudohongiella sp.]
MTVSHGPDLKAREHLETLVESSRKTSKLSFIISIIAICVAASSVYFAYRDSREDAEWQESQLQLLEEISSKLTSADVSSQASGN